MNALAWVAWLAVHQNPPQGDVTVRIDSDVPVDIYEIESSENYVAGMVYAPTPGVLIPNIQHRERSHRLCVAPCSVTMPHDRAALEHEIVSNNVTDAGTFTFSDYGSSVLVHIRGGNAERYRGGKVAAVAGGVTLGISALVGLVGSFDRDARVPLIGAGVIGAILGAASLFLGIFTMFGNRTFVEMDTDPSAPPAAPAPEGAPVPL
jgi:hypothetical protein